MTTNSQRNNVEAAMTDYFDKRLEADASIEKVVPELADAIFEALGITEDEQNSTGGYFMHHAGKKDYAEYILIPLTEQIKEALSWEEAGDCIWKFITEARKQ